MTEAAKHTPGPWAMNMSGDSVYKDIGAAMTIATVCGDGFENPQRKANARLIAAAPDLAAALEPFAAIAAELDALRHEDGSTCTWRLRADDIRRARAALAKATGS